MSSLKKLFRNPIMLGAMATAVGTVIVAPALMWGLNKLGVRMPWAS
jgi:hypothetical protein